MRAFQTPGLIPVSLLGVKTRPLSERETPVLLKRLKDTRMVNGFRKSGKTDEK